jgi:hypothetical protein
MVLLEPLPVSGIDDVCGLSSQDVSTIDKTCEPRKWK